MPRIVETRGGGGERGEEREEEREGGRCVWCLREKRYEVEKQATGLRCRHRCDGRRRGEVAALARSLARCCPFIELPAPGER